jgi:hypothetical protein
MSDVKNNVLHIVDTLNNGFEGYLVENEYGEMQTAFDYLQDVLEFNWILNSDRTLKGARMLVAFGGPNIWIDTTRGIVDGYWWQDKFVAEYDTQSEFARDLDEALETLFNC